MSVEQLPPLKERCFFCKKRRATKLCDFVEGEFWTSIDFKKTRVTCDREICEKCASNLGEEFDFCPIHAKIAREKLR